MPTVALLVSESLRVRIFDDATWQTLNQLVDIKKPDGDISREEACRLLPGAVACITGWGSPRLDAEVLACADELKLVAHSAGSVKGFISPELWAKGIRVTSSSASLAIDVAWATLGMMILAKKNVFLVREEVREGAWGNLKSRPPGELYGCRIGIVGASHVGRNVIRLLKESESHILLYDPFVSSEQAGEMGVEKTEDLNELVRICDIVSIHAPSLPETRHMFNAENLPLLKDGAILINTARGALIDENALIAELKTGRIFACLDVTDPEPPAPDSPFRTLPNVLLTPHLTGSTTEGQKRLGAFATEEIRRFLAGEPQRYEVTAEALSRIA